MASISKNPRTGAKRILFVGPLLDADGKPVLDLRGRSKVKRRAVHLGKEDVDAEAVGRTDAKPRTLLNLDMFANRLIDCFGADKPLSEIKRGDADRWVIHLKKQCYAAATIGRTIKGARQFFKAAVRDEIIDRNPFDGIKAGSHVDKERKRFVTPEEIQLVMDACPDAEWRLIVALSRWAGLRCPSEHLALTWQDVDWARERFLVRSPKTGERWVPIFPELRPYLDEVFHKAEPGTVHVITTKRDGSINLRTRFMKIIHRAGLKAWRKLFHNLRRAGRRSWSRSTPCTSYAPGWEIRAW